MGNDETFVTINFPGIEQMDKDGKSKYVVGGRVYFESNAIGNGI